MDVYQPAEDSYLLQKYVQRYARGKVLDLGTGSGIQAITAAKSSEVQSVLAVDINKKAVKELKQKIKKENITKIKTKTSDLFSKVRRKFDLIIFNPPYLPQDEGIEDKAIYGGKKGWELSKKFFEQVAEYLKPEGKILFLFSSLTNKNKIDEMIKKQLLISHLFGTEKLSFEELYVYLIEKSKILQELELQGITKIKYFTHGRRGNIFTGYYNRKKVAIKIKRAESRALERTKNEAHWLEILNEKKIGPKFLFAGNDYLVYQFVEGEFILDWVRKNKTNKTKKVLTKIFQQCFIMDQLKVNKEEMHHPLKHILVKNSSPVLIDFERCKNTEKPQNVTQLIEFICRMKSELEKKDFTINVKQFRELAREYKNEQNKNNFLQIIELLK